MITIRSFSIDIPLGDGQPFETVYFEKGINLIVGERSSDKVEKSQQEKMNSVGKSLLVEMINYCLLKDPKSSRVTRIPFDVLPFEAYLCLDLDYETDSEIKKIQIKRTRDTEKPIIISVDGEATEFLGKEIEKAADYLGHYFLYSLDEKPSLRRLVSILIRDEKTGFDDILRPSGSHPEEYSTLISPHAYLFQISLTTINTISSLNKKLEKVSTVASEVKKRITYEGVKLSDVRSYINELDREVQKLDAAANAMQPSEGAQQLVDELNDLNSQLEELVTNKSSKETLARKIKTIPRRNRDINPKDLAAVYDKYKSGLGDIVARSLDDTLRFRNQIDEFEQELLSDRLVNLTAEITDLTSRIKAVDERIATIYDAIGYTKQVTDFRVSLHEQNVSHDKLNRLKQEYRLFQEKEAEKKRLEKERADLIDQVEVIVFELDDAIRGFEKDLILIHEAVYDNAQCQFKIEIKESAPKQYLLFTYRTYLDGGASSDRIKTFMYDTLLMLNSHTKRRHPRFLIHDNVFAAVGKNDMVNALNYLEAAYAKDSNFQYIVTINKDEFEAQEKSFSFDTSKKKRVVLTREKQLLHQKYAELEPKST